jgi:hypothetical protein
MEIMIGEMGCREYSVPKVSPEGIEAFNKMIREYAESEANQRQVGQYKIGGRMPAPPVIAQRDATKVVTPMVEKKFERQVQPGLPMPMYMYPDVTTLSANRDTRTDAARDRYNREVLQRQAQADALVKNQHVWNMYRMPVTKENLQKKLDMTRHLTVAPTMAFSATAFPVAAGLGMAGGTGVNHATIRRTGTDWGQYMADKYGGNPDAWAFTNPGYLAGLRPVRAINRGVNRLVKLPENPKNVIKDSRDLYEGFKLRGESERVLTKKELNFLQDEFARTGHLAAAKRKFYAPYTKFVRKAIHPWEYNLRKHINEIKFAVKNPEQTKVKYDNRFQDKNLAPATEISEKNRYAMWDLYTGESMKKYNPFEVSNLSTTKRPVFTIKKEATDVKAGRGYLIDTAVSKFGKRDIIPYKADKSGYYTIPMLSEDNMFGVMGKFSFKVKEVTPNDKYHLIATDLWDLHPFQKYINKYKKYIPIIKNMRIGSPEIGKTLKIGKSIDTKVQFDVQRVPAEKRLWEWNDYEVLRQYRQGGVL